MKKHNTTKHRKRSKKEKDSRRASKQKQLIADVEEKILSDQQLSPARQAFKELDEKGGEG